LKRIMTKQIVLAAVLSLVTGAAWQARAGSVTSYTDRTSFNTAVAVPLTVEDFTSSYHLPITTGVLNSSTNLVVSGGSPITPGLIQPGVTYSTPIGTGDFFNIDFGGGGLRRWLS
jgi:hypothetical protein